MKASLQSKCIASLLLLLAFNSNAQVGSLIRNTKSKVDAKVQQTTNNTNLQNAVTGENTGNGVTVQQTEDHLKALLGEGAYYSAAMMQGKVLPIYKPANDVLQPTSVFGVIIKDQYPNLSDFQLINAALTAQMLTDERTMQMTESEIDFGNGLLKVINGVGPTKNNFTIIKWQNGLAGYKIINKNESRFIYVPFKKDLTTAWLPQAYDAAANGLDEANAMFDIYTTQRSAAMAANLAQGKPAMLAELKACAKSIRDGEKAQDAEDSKNAVFPTAAMKDPALEKELVAVVQKSGKELDFDPTQLKKLIITSDDWGVRKNDLGVILGKVLSVTIGFSKEGHCYYTSFQVQRDYEGGSSYQKRIYCNGFTSRWEEILCENIK